jgi:ATP-dependent RNA helicase DDX46/PRP5
VEQRIELFDREEEKFRRLLEILREWYQEEGRKIIIFVENQRTCSTLFQELLGADYPCCLLHGGIDQKDRANTLEDFKREDSSLSILVATSLIARGLDVKNLELVINYDVPNHMEDYVHRVGRTGRAGETGTAYTFILRSQERYCPDILEAVMSSGKTAPQELIEIAERYEEERKAKKLRKRSGFIGSGYKFTENEATAKINERKLLIKFHSGAGGEDDDDDDDDNDDEDTALSSLQSAEEAAMKSAQEQARSVVEAAVAAANVGNGVSAPPLTAPSSSSSSSLYNAVTAT